MKYDATITKTAVDDEVDVSIKIKIDSLTTPTIEYEQGQSLYLVQKKYVLQALIKNDGHRKATAKELRIATRTLATYIEAIRKEGIPIPKGKSGYRKETFVSRRGLITVDTY